MPGRNVALLGVSLIISLPCLAALPLTQAPNNPAKATNPQEIKETKERKPSPAAQSQTQQAPPKGAPQKPKTGTAAGVERKDAAAEAEQKEEKRKRLILQAIQTLDGAIAQTKELHPVVKIKIRSLAADALWKYQEARAREMLTEDFQSIAAIGLPQEDPGKPPTYKKRSLEEVKAELRKELIVILNSHDPALTASLLAAEKGDNKYGLEGEALRTFEMLDSAFGVAATNTDMAARIIKDSLKTGIHSRLAMSLIGHRRFAPAEASAIFNEAFSLVKASGDLWEFQKLVPYVLPIEADLSGSYLADPLRAKDTKTFLEYAAVMLARQLETPQVTVNSPPELIMREIYLWQSLIKLFSDLAPDKVWMVNRRIHQLSLLRPELKKPLEAANPSSSPQELLKSRIAEAEAATGPRRDLLFAAAASAALRLEDLNQAIALIDKIENREQREISGSSLLNTASLKALNREGPDKALAIARRIRWPSTRVTTFSQIINALRSLGKQEQAAELLGELLVWFDGYQDNTDKVWGLLTYLDHFAKDEADRDFTALNLLISLLNNADLDPPAQPLPNRRYWYPEFHDFRKSLGPLAKTDFDRALQEAQLLRNKEARLLVQVALCHEYLKLDKPQPAAVKAAQ
jgi:hypothetical protein